MIEGLVTLKRVLLPDGKEMTTQRAVELGWILPAPRQRPRGWGLERHEVVVGKNLFTDNGRQLMAFAFGERSPISNFTCRKFGLGTGITPPKVTDVSLESPISFYLGGQTKPINTVDFSTPFVAKVEFTIAASEANGFLITEMGLFSGNDTLIARRVHVGINKTSDFSPVLGWRIRF